jgi:hypothetical protein
MSEENGESDNKKPKPKLTDLLKSMEPTENSQVNIYFSRDNWKSCNSIDIMIEEKTTILQLIDASLYKLKTQFNITDIDEKKCYIMLLKKKTKKPNYDYPRCNPDSLVIDYQKSNFCLMEDIPLEQKDVQSGSKEEKKEEEIKEKEEAKDDKKEDENKEGKNIKGKKDKKNEKDVKGNDKKVKKDCIIF